MTSEDKLPDTLSSLHPLLQREDMRRANRRRRKVDCLDSTLETSCGDITDSIKEFDTDNFTPQKLVQLQNSIDTLKCSEQSLKRENSILIEKLAVGNISTVDDTGEELRASLVEIEKIRGEGRKVKEELKLCQKRNAYLESEMETFKLKLSLSETRCRETDNDLKDCQKKLDQTQNDLSALKSRESEVSRLISEAESDRRSLQRIKDVQSTLSHNSRTIDDLREAMMESSHKVEVFEEENRLLRIQLESAEREKKESDNIGRDVVTKIKQLECNVVELEAELVKAKAESLTHEKRFTGIEKAKEAELNYLKDQINTKDQLIACKSMTLDGLKKETNTCRQEVRGMEVALEIKEFELEQLRQFKLLIKDEREEMKQVSSMKETLSDIQNKYEELKIQTETQNSENEAKQESLQSQIAELRKSRRSLIKQLKQLEQLYTAKENTHCSMESEFSKLSQLFYALRENKIIPDSKQVQHVLESIYQPSDSKLPELSSIIMDSDSQYVKPGLKRSLSAGSELKSILKKSNSPKCSTPNTSQQHSPNIPYSCTKNTAWLSTKEISGVL
ncbi:hypothetical protein LOD99_10128 [Oopsacas minuta]|uniref:Uncharacterized protein n=1 Tax=Oopsacas minuta TaxID=111878 RepID=A0AAV7KJS7_9METZ|nr:hypothetical protein LOD99_10128 [Oopsacas minuta]